MVVLHAMLGQTLMSSYTWSAIGATHFATIASLQLSLYSFRTFWHNSVLLYTVEYQYNEILGTSEINLL